MSEYKPFKMKGSPMKRNFPESMGSSTANSGDSPLEKFDWGSALSGAVKGAKAGSVAGPWGMLAGALGGGAMSGFAGGKQIEDQEAENELAQKTEEEKDQLLLAAKKKSEREESGYGGFDAVSS